MKIRQPTKVTRKHYKKGKWARPWRQGNSTSIRPVAWSSYIDGVTSLWSSYSLVSAQTMRGVIDKPKNNLRVTSLVKCFYVTILSKSRLTSKYWVQCTSYFEFYKDFSPTDGTTRFKLSKIFVFEAWLAEVVATGQCYGSEKWGQANGALQGTLRDLYNLTHYIWIVRVVKT